jgi:phosphoglycolate phosphatase-like HAD superfamily hydrolase
MPNFASWTSAADPERAIATPLLTSGSTVFCDFDGPLVDVSDRYYHTYLLALEATATLYLAQGQFLPLRRLTKAQFWCMKQNRIPDITIADWSGLAPDQVPTFLQQVEQFVNQPSLLHEDHLQPGVIAALTALQDREVRVVIVTLRQTAQVFEFLHHHDLVTTISQVYGAQDAFAAYPNRIQHKVLQLREAISEQQRLGFDTQSSWMIGDTEADICAGQAAKIATIALTCGIRSAAYLQGFNPTRIYRDLYAATEFLTTQVLSSGTVPAIPVSC